MPGLNKIQLIGNMGRDPETKSVGRDGKPVTTFTVAVNRRWKSNDGETNEATDWFNVEAWAGLANTVAQYGRKGRLVYVEGRLQTDRYEDSHGQTRYYTKVVANNIQFLDRQQSSGDDGPDDE